MTGKKNPPVQLETTS